MQSSFFLIIISCFFSSFISAQTYIPGETYFGDNNYIEYKAGNLPIIISAPHGGNLQPNEIPDRNCANCVYTKDLFTEELARLMYEAIFDLFGCYPHLIINRLHRRKLDANRAIGDAADGHPIGEQAWTEFQDFIELAKDTVEAKYGKGLYVDLHGHGHDIQRLELGYRITKSELQLSDETLNQAIYVNDASIKNLVNSNLNGLNLSELLRGTESFGQLYEQQNYPAVPSYNDPYPSSGDDYFRGGYNTERHGSKSNGTVDAIQIECNMDGVRDSESNRVAFANTTANIFKSYLETHYFETDLTMSDCELVTNIRATNLPSIIDINTFPNPVVDYLTVDFRGINQIYFSISILNELGQIVYQNKQVTSPFFQIAFQNYPKGIYFLKLETGDFVSIKKIIK